MDVKPCAIQDVETFVQSVLTLLQIDNWDVSVVFCSNDFIRGLNKQYRNKDEATDVLSFCQSVKLCDAGEHTDQFSQAMSNIDASIDEVCTHNAAAGDIVISLEYLKQNAKIFNVSVSEELHRLLVHGILHLKGMDHSTNDPTEEMLVLQEDLLKRAEDMS
ncbi:MAG: rRNA maturation RNase YbeY [Termitinemataceae bacterium]|nr:MAG: rRNA maturation RNase YbeY [Termitinemataceae bacterium]